MTKETPAERFQRLYKLPIGGASVLWKALDLQTNQSAVLKCPHPDTDKYEQERNRIEQEAHAYEYLGPVPGLVSFLSYETNEEGPVLALEFLPGKTLRNYLINHPALPEKKIIVIGRALCQIVGQLHERGVIHRDLSLSNVMLLDGSEEVRLIDLGLALVPTPNGKSYEPHELGRVGTEETLAPELSTSFSGDRRSDIYSLGRILYKITVGLDTKTKEMETSFGVSSSVSDEFKQVIFRCTKKNPQDRYQTVGELDGALAALSTIPTKKASPPPVSTKNKRLSGIGFLLLGIGFSFGGAAIIKILSRTPEPQPSPSPTIILVERPPQLHPTETPAQPPLPGKLEPKTTEGLKPKKAAKTPANTPTLNSVTPPKSLMEEEDSGLKDLPIANAFKHVPPTETTPIHISTDLAAKKKK